MMSLELHIIADIPQDITGSSANILPSNVYAITGSQKKKRSETALAIDHQGVNIYDV